MRLTHGDDKDCPLVQNGTWKRCLGHTGAEGDEFTLKPRAKALKLICSWCLNQIRDGAEPASHGICEKCVATNFPDVKPGEPKYMVVNRKQLEIAFVGMMMTAVKYGMPKNAEKVARDTIDRLNQTDRNLESDLREDR